MKPIDLRYITTTSHTCHWEVVRGGMADSCDKLAVAVTVDEHHDDPAFPACANHANRAGAHGHQVVPLHILVRSWKGAL